MGVRDELVRVNVVVEKETDGVMTIPESPETNDNKGESGVRLI